MTDLAVNENYDLQIINGDFQISDSADQHVEFVFKSNPGDWKEHIETGIAIERSTNGNVDRFLDRTIRVQMQANGYKIKELMIAETGVTINGKYDGI